MPAGGDCVRGARGSGGDGHPWGAPRPTPCLPPVCPLVYLRAAPGLPLACPGSAPPACPRPAPCLPPVCPPCLPPCLPPAAGPARPRPKQGPRGGSAGSVAGSSQTALISGLFPATRLRPPRNKTTTPLFPRGPFSSGCVHVASFLTCGRPGSCSLLRQSSCPLRPSIPASLESPSPHQTPFPDTVNLLKQSPALIEAFTSAREATRKCFLTGLL